jgi:hypothetical protein
MTDISDEMRAELLQKVSTTEGWEGFSSSQRATYLVDFCEEIARSKENLAHVNLTALERCILTKRQKEIWDNFVSHPYVYIVQNTVTSNIKIGISVDPYHRLSTLQTGCDCKLKLLCFFPGNESTERELHSRLAEYRIHGEWFYFTNEVEMFLEPLIEEYKNDL